MRRGASLALRVTAFAALAAAPASAQFPAELVGRAVEQGTAQPIVGALVEAGAARAVTDAAGAFVLRAAGAGLVEVTISHPGYAELRASRRLESGRTSIEVFALTPVVVPIDGIAVLAEVAPGFAFGREEIARSGAQTLGELLRGVPGVLVRDAQGGGSRVSIRGGSADQVLVLVDGVPVNDAVTGEADAAAVSLQDVRSVRVLAGAQSARFGARAAAGVIVVETSDAHEPFAAASVEAGSLGAFAVDAQAGTRGEHVSFSGGARLRGADGEFDFDRPDALGGGRVARGNADERELGGFASAAIGALGRVRLRADVARIERGLPGPMHAPTPEARQDVARGDVRASWDVHTPAALLRAAANVGLQRVRYGDPAPAFGPAYHDTTRVREAGARFEAERSGGMRLSRTVAAGAELRRVVLESSSLEPAHVARVDAAVFARGAFALPMHAHAPRLAVAVRGDRWSGRWIPSHDVALSTTVRRVNASLAHRSAFSPPAASDQFFAAGFAIAPNPLLEPERVRSELEATLTTSFEARVPVELGVSAFRGDVDGMIVWAPDFRFVWSPRNRDVKRSGGETWLRVRAARDVQLRAWAARARVTYDWAGDADTVQVVYRPRYSGGVSAEWMPDPWSFALDGLYTGVRYATPGHANPLPAYWDVRLAAGRTFRLGPAQGEAALRVDRLLDNTDSFVHGYAEPGRRFSIEVRLRGARRADDITITQRDS